MFLMTNRAGTIFDHIRLVQGVMLMAFRALQIDRSKFDPVPELIGYDIPNFRQPYSVVKGRGTLVTFLAVASDGRMVTRYLARAEEIFRSVTLEHDDGGSASGKGEHTCKPACDSPWM